MIAKQTTMPSQVAEALARLEWLAISKNTHDAINTLRAELHRLTEIADGVEPLVIGLGEVTTQLERANALLREAHPFVPVTHSSTGRPQLHSRIQSHLLGAGDEA